MDRLKVWLVTIGETHPLEKNGRRMRTAMLADKLAAKGHDVLWWTSAFDHFRKEWIFGADVEVAVNKRLKLSILKGTGYRKNISMARIIDHRVIARKFRKESRKAARPDIIIASTPAYDLAFEAVSYAKENDVPVLVDVRDPWPDIFLDAVPHPLRGAARLALHKDFQMIKKTMRLADGLLAPTDTFLKWGLGYAQRERNWKDRVFYLGYEKYVETLNAGRFGGLMETIKGKFIVFFVGAISRSYHNPMIILDAAGRFSGREDIHFVIAGNGELFGELKDAARGMDNVTLTGWLDQPEIAFFLRHSRVGVCPATSPVDLPTNKVFSYLAEGLPVISAFGGELKKLIEDHDIGFYYPPGDAASLAASIERLRKDHKLYKTMSSNAGRLFSEMFDAVRIYGEYAAHTEKVAFEALEAAGRQNLF